MLVMNKWTTFNRWAENWGLCLQGCSSQRTQKHVDGEDTGKQHLIRNLFLGHVAERTIMSCSRKGNMYNALSPLFIPRMRGRPVSVGRPRRGHRISTSVPVCVHVGGQEEFVRQETTITETPVPQMYHVQTPKLHKRKAFTVSDEERYAHAAVMNIKRSKCAAQRFS